MSDKSKVIIILSAIFVVLGGLFCFLTFKDYLHKNPEDLVGNTAGNLNNGGYFCQTGDTVFFANGYDDGKLYAMNADETNIRKLSEVKVSQLNADDKYLYYYLSDVQAPSGLGGFSVPMLGIYRSDHKGKGAKSLERVSCGVVKLIGNTLYYQQYTDSKHKTLQGMDVRSKETETLLDFPANPASAYGTAIYYNGMEEDHHLYRYHTESRSNAMLYEGNVWNPDAQGDYIYFMNIDDDYKLCRYDMGTGEVQTLTRDRVDQYLVCGSYIFYQKNSENDPALMVMYTDGSEPRVIAEGNYSNLNATTKFIYFTAFGTDMPVYKVSLENSSFQMMTFDGAKQAAIESNQ
ncbi:MAG: DUF5050 domain-containing protein [Lachnospiraceae bacterium]